MEPSISSAGANVWGIGGSPPRGVGIRGGCLDPRIRFVAREGLSRGCGAPTLAAAVAEGDRSPRDAGRPERGVVRFTDAGTCTRARSASRHAGTCTRAIRFTSCGHLHARGHLPDDSRGAARPPSHATSRARGRRARRAREGRASKRRSRHAAGAARRDVRSCSRRSVRQLTVSAPTPPCARHDPAAGHAGRPPERGHRRGSQEGTVAAGLGGVRSPRVSGVCGPRGSRGCAVPAGLRGVRSPRVSGVCGPRGFQGCAVATGKRARRTDTTRSAAASVPRVPVFSTRS